MRSIVIHQESMVDYAPSELIHPTLNFASSGVMGICPRSSRNAKLQTPPGPEGSNGSSGTCAEMWLRAPLINKWSLAIISKTHQVLARKWRPKTLEEMVGQGSLVKTLTNALAQNRLHHAYLFTGTRGIGKTTAGRILAKCLNCDTGVTPTPCGQCNACTSIDEGRFIDLLEIDAASRTKVEDTRELLDNVQYAPTQGRFKTYLIDEVHMLSGHSFNALLKTLEEPPPHAKFILATTDPERLPITVLSRCLQFHLKNMAPETIQPHLKFILDQEKINYETDALMRLGVAAKGSMRDALSLLDQAIAYGNGAIHDTDVKNMLGTIDPQALFDLLNALGNQDGQTIYQTLLQIDEFQQDYLAIADELISLLHHCALLQTWPDLPLRLYDRPKLLALTKLFKPEEIQLLYQIALMGRRDLPLNPTPKCGFEMMILRMYAFRPHEPHAHKTTPITQKLDWETLISQLNLSGMTHSLAQHCVATTLTPERVELLLHPNQLPLLNKSSEERLTQAIKAHFGPKTQVTIASGQTDALSPALQKAATQQEAQQKKLAELSQDDNIQALLSTFNAKIEL